MSTLNLHVLCVCAGCIFKRVSRIRNIFLKKHGKKVNSEKEKFQYNSYIIFNLISMRFVLINYYINLCILGLPILNTSEHFLANNACFTYKGNAHFEHFRTLLSIFLHDLEGF